MDDILKLDLDEDFQSFDLSKQKIKLPPTNTNTINRSSDFGLDLLINKDRQKTPSNSPKPTFEPSFKSNITSNIISKPANSFAPNTLNLTDDLEIEMDAPTEGITVLKENNLPTRSIFEPVNPVTTNHTTFMPSTAPINMPPRKSFEEIQREKAILLRQMERYKAKGIRTFQNFDMNSDYDDIKFEYENIKEEVTIRRSVKNQKNMLITTTRLMEHASQTELVQDFTGKLELEGWSEHIMETVDDDFEEIFEDLHEKYGDLLTGKQYPELRLVWALGHSAIMFHITKKFIQNSKIPNIDTLLKTNPAFMAEFKKAASNTISQRSPAYRNMMNDMNEFNENKKRDMNGPDNLDEIMARLS